MSYDNELPPSTRASRTGNPFLPVLWALRELCPRVPQTSFGAERHMSRPFPADIAYEHFDSPTVGENVC